MLLVSLVTLGYSLCMHFPSVSCARACVIEISIPCVRAVGTEVYMLRVRAQYIYAVRAGVHAIEISLECARQQKCFHI